jgi:glycosyltransferase involved in cell wall biosynthesis
LCIGFAGWIQREKGIFEALAAFSRLARRFPTAQFVLAGGGRDLDQFRDRVRAAGLEGRVWTMGWVSRRELYPVLRSFDIFVLPSHFEGLPNAVLEAMAAELPVVATRVGAIPDVVVDAKSGYLVDVGDVDALEARLGELLADPARARAMGSFGGVLVRQRFDIETVWPRYLTALERACATATTMPDRARAELST